MTGAQVTLLQQALSGKPLADCPVVDFHVHLRGWAVQHLPVAADALIGYMDRVGVRMICVNGILHPAVREANDMVAEFVSRHPSRAVGIAALNPFQCDVEDELKRCVFDLGFKGIKVHDLVAIGDGRHPRGDPRRAGGTWENVWRLAAEHSLPVLYHGVATLDDVRDFPETAFVWAHGLCVITGRETKYALAELPNLYVDTASTQNIVAEAAETIRIFGPHRIIWGSDAPLDDFAQRLGIVLDMALEEDEKKQILGGNALRLLGLPAR